MVAGYKHALIIEDEFLVASEIADALLDLGFRSFDTADNAADALSFARRRRPDLIAADYRIRGGTGAEALSAIIGAIGPTPTKFVSEDREADWGVEGVYVFKPVTSWALVVACHSLGLR